MKKRKDLRDKFPMRIIPDLNWAKWELEDKVLKGMAIEQAVNESFKMYFPKQKSYRGYKKKILNELSQHAKDRNNFSRFVSSNFSYSTSSVKNIARPVRYPTMDEQEMELYNLSKNPKE